MHPNFCTNCGARLTRKSWRVWLRGPICDDCATRPGVGTYSRAFIGIALIAIVAFAFGRYLRPAPPPLIIQRAANSPLSDAPVNLNSIAKANGQNAGRTVTGASSAGEDDTVYLCGARTKKGAPCRRRVQIAGERCFQHKGRSAMVSLEKLTIKPDTRP